MKCNVKFEELSLYADNRIEPEKKSQVLKHVLICPLCMERLEALNSVKARLQALPKIHESESFDFEFRKKLDARLKAKRRIHIPEIDLSGILDSLRVKALHPAPAFVKVAVSFAVIFAIITGMHFDMLSRRPCVEFIAGDAKLYRPAQDKWININKDVRLRAGDRIETDKGSILNILCKDKYKARIKDSGVIVIAQADSGLRNVDVGFSVSYGDLQVNTADRFKGSKMRVYTPACDAEVVGTSFIVRVPYDNPATTWLGVLEGKVKVLSRVHPLKIHESKQKFVYVTAGQKTEISQYDQPAIPELLSDKEWRTMQELYQLTEVPEIMLLVGMQSDRIDELLRPAPIYIPDMRPRALPAKVQDVIDSITKATDKQDTATVIELLPELEKYIEVYGVTKFKVEILMFIASHYHFAKDEQNAIRVFDSVIREYPKSQLASLAQCAVATIYQRDLGDIKKAKQSYRDLVEMYPDSVDAIRAKEMLSVIG